LGLRGNGKMRKYRPREKVDRIRRRRKKKKRHPSPSK